MAVKKFTWCGKTEEELAQLSLKEFTLLVTSRARRSLRRGFTPAQKALLHRLEAGENHVKTHCRGMLILPIMLGKTLRVHAGKEWENVTIVPEMLGHRLGEFSQTRKSVKHSAAGIGATRSSKAVSAR